MKRIISCWGLTLILSCVNYSFAEDWSQYRGQNGDGISDESITNVNWNAQKPEIIWKASTPLGFSSFSIADGRAFTLIAQKNESGENVETCLALNAKNGEELWAVPFGLSDYGHDGGNAGAPDNKGGDGPRSTPTTDGDHVFVYDAHLVLTCLDAKQGEVIWQRDVLNEFSGENIKWRNATSPLLVNDVIFVGGGGEGQSFLAFNKNSGDLIWKSGNDHSRDSNVYFTQGARPGDLFCSIRTRLNKC